MARRSPWSPIFNPDPSSGSIVTGNTPGIPNDYFSVANVFIDGLIYFIYGTTIEDVTWETLAEVAANDTADEGVKGVQYFQAWFAESGNAPANYTAARDGIGGCIWGAAADDLALDDFASQSYNHTSFSGGIYYYTRPGAFIRGSLLADYDLLVLGAGGAGVGDFGSTDQDRGGGGAGEYHVSNAETATYIQITGIGVGGPAVNFQTGGDGGDTVTSIKTAVGGGGGGYNAVGRPGGSGGGGNKGFAGGTGTAGNNGGTGTTQGGGGGGSGGAGSNGTPGAGTTWANNGITYCVGGDPDGTLNTTEGSGGRCSNSGQTQGLNGLVAIDPS